MYDALNVLIAADILKKKGKQVFSEITSNINGISSFLFILINIYKLINQVYHLKRTRRRKNTN